MLIVDEQPIRDEDLGQYRFSCENFEVTIGEGDTLLSELLDKVVMSMVVGETGYIKTKVNSEGKSISKVSMSAKELKFNISLISLERAADSEELEKDESLDRAQHHKDNGTSLFKAGRHEFAQKRFTKALEYLKTLSPNTLPLELRKQCCTLQCQCHLNMTACYLKTEQWDTVILHCDKVLLLEETNVKAMFRKGKAYIGLLDYDAALKVMRHAALIEPDNKAVLSLINDIHNLIKKHKEVYKKMFK